MSSVVIDDFTTAWVTDGSGLWSATTSAGAACLGTDATGMTISAHVGVGSPFVQRVFDPVLDLRDASELRFWLRSSRAAPSASACYLAFGAGDDPTSATLPWRRRLRVDRPHAWDLHRLWLDDMPPALRQSVAVLRLQSLDPSVEFGAAVDDLWAGTPEALRDVETALLTRLHHRFSVGVTPVPALFDVPPGQQQPYIAIDPLAVVPAAEVGGADVIDNDTADGAFVRTHPRRIRLDYRVQVFAADRAQRAHLIGRTVAELAREPRLNAFAEPVVLLPYEPSPAATGPTVPGVTPLYYRALVWQEVGPRAFAPRAVPLLATAQPHSPAPEESLV